MKTIVFQFVWHRQKNVEYSLKVYSISKMTKLKAKILLNNTLKLGIPKILDYLKIQFLKTWTLNCILKLELYFFQASSLEQKLMSSYPDLIFE